MRLLVLVLAVLTYCGSAYADTWVVSQYGSDPDRSIIFTFENGALSCNRSSYSYTLRPGLPSWETYAYSLQIYSQPWAVCRDEFGQADAYATFVTDDTFAGHVQWADGTPQGYQTSLRIGGGSPSSLKLFCQYWGGFYGDYYSMSLTQLEHTFVATVPEPSSLAAVGFALAAVAGGALRRRGVSADMSSVLACLPGRGRR